MTGRITILFLTTRLQGPSARFRVLQLVPAFQAAEYGVAVREIPKGLFRRWRLFRDLARFDIVFLQKRIFRGGTLRYLRRKARRLLYDFDDAVMFRDSNAGNLESGSRFRRFRATLKCCDGVVAGNEYLRSIGSPFHPGIRVIPTPIDTHRYRPKPVGAPHGEVTLGWIGSKPNLIYLERLAGTINALYEESPTFRLKIVCDDFIDGFSCPVERKAWSGEDEVRDIQSFDIGLMPLHDDPWTRGKCALKLLQYMSCGLASVSSRNPVTSGMVTEGASGMLASSEGEWADALRVLLRDASLRSAMGGAARRSLEGRYDVPSVAAAYDRLFRETVGGTGSPGSGF